MFVLGLPAMSADSRSLDILLRTLGELYAGAQDPASGAFPYVQFAQWQNELLDSEDEESRQARNRWQADYPPGPIEPRLPLERQMSESAAEAGHVDRVLTSAITSRLDALAARVNASPAEVLLACWQALLSRLSGLPSFAVAMPLDGRGYEQLQDAVGLFSKCTPVPVNLTGDVSVREVIQHVRESVERANESLEYFDPRSSRAALQFSYHELPEKRLYGDVWFEMVRQQVHAERFKLKLEVQRSATQLVLRFHYDAARLAPESVARWASHFRTLLDAALESPETPVSRLPLLEDTERRRLLYEWNRTAADYPQQCLPQLFEAQVARTPERPALRVGEQQLSYQQLNECANRLAHYLRGAGIGPDALVALAVERSAQMLVAVLGILKAGGAYVPLNPENPKARLAQQLAGTALLLTEQKLLAQMPEFQGRTLCLDRDQPLWANESDATPQPNTTPENLVYVIYTSGSTGLPKGVAVRHRNLVNYTHFISQWLHLAEFPQGLHFATVSTIGADLGNTCIFPSLLCGGCLHIIRYEDSTDPQRLAHYAQRHPIDVLKIVPSHLQALLSGAEAPQLLPNKYLILGGERLTARLLERVTSLGARCEILNHYGPTETTVGSLTLRLEDYDWRHSPADSIPIGRPIANTQLYILDQHLQPVPLGVIGELYLAGAGLTAGYLNQPDKTAERFLANPFSADPTARMYRTGDRVRYWPDGNVEFLGRADDQVKIRGFRIELGEIESILTQQSSVKQALIVAQEDERGDKRLIAYVVPQREQTLSTQALHEHLKQHLPDYMLPAAILPLAKLPLTPNGKIDRQALPSPEQATAHTKTYLAPATPTEEIVAAIWCEVLRRERISSTDNFFELGGHSLLATQVISRLRQHFRVELAMRIMFEKPTVQGIAQSVESASQLEEGADSPIRQLSRDAYRVRG